MLMAAIFHRISVILFLLVSVLDFQFYLFKSKPALPDRQGKPINDL
jgi:hypothetical protein